MAVPTLSVTGSGATTDLKWTSVSGTKGYVVDRAVRWGSFHAVAYVPSPTTTYLDTNQDGSDGPIQSGVWYRYRIRADGGLPSNWVAVNYSPNPNPFPPRRLFVASNGSASLVDPDAMKVLSSVSLPALVDPRAATVDPRGFVYVALGGAGQGAIVAIGSSPARVVGVLSLGSASQLQGGQCLLLWRGPRLLVGDFGQSTLVVVDVTDPTSMKVTNTMVASPFTTGQPMGVLKLSDTKVMLLPNANNRIPTIDVSNPDAPKLTGGYGTIVLRQGEGPVAGVFDGTHAYIAFDAGGLSPFDVAQGRTPYALGLLLEPRMSLTPNLFFDTDHAQVIALGVGEGAAGGTQPPPAMVVVDVSVPSNPRTTVAVGHPQLQMPVVGLAVIDRRAFALCEGALIPFDLDAQTWQTPLVDTHFHQPGALALVA